MNAPFYCGLQFGCGLAAAVLIVILIMNLFKPHDSTDAPGKRSGISVYTDHKTGMQYLGTPNGGITPRLGSDGQQMRAEQ